MKKLLICDDDEDLLILVTYLLKDGGWDVFTSNDCDNIIDKVSKYSPSVILMDIAIPHAGGIEAAQLLKQHPDLSRIPIIMFSSHSEIASLANTAGADLYLAKPFGAKKFEDVIERALEIYRANIESDSLKCLNSVILA